MQWFLYPKKVAVVWELPFTRCRARILIHPENYSTVICLTTFAILRADRSLSSYLIIFPLFLSFSFLSPRSNRPSRASHERVARSCIAGDSDSSETRVDLQGRIFYRPCPRCFHEQRYPLAVVQEKISDWVRSAQENRTQQEVPRDGGNFKNLPPSFLRNNCSLRWSILQSVLHSFGLNATLIKITNILK